MADEKKIPKVGYSTNLTIGGKSYKSDEISRLKPQIKEFQTVTGQENAPRNVAKALSNEAGTIKTDDLSHSQGDSRMPTPRQTVSPTSETRTDSTPFNASMPAPHPTVSVQTGSEQQKQAQESAKGFTTQFTTPNIRTSGDAGLSHEQSRVPQAVEGIKTATGGQQGQAATPLPSAVLSPAMGVKSPTSEERPDSTRISMPDVVASRMPTQGMSMGAAYFTTIAAGRHDSMRSNIDISSIQTSGMRDKAAETRAAQGVLQGSYTPSHIIKNTGLEAKASFYEAMGRFSSGKVALSQNAKNALSVGGSLAIGKTQEALSSYDDMGTQIAGGAITTGVAAYTGFKIAQTASPILINGAKGIVSVGKGAWDVSTTVGKATVTIARTANILSSNFFPFTPQFTKSVLLRQAQITGVLHTATSQRIISGVKQVQTNLANIKTTIVSTGQGIKTGVVTATNAARRTFTLVRGVVNGNVMSGVIAHEALLKAGYFAKRYALKGMKIVGRRLANGAVIGGVWAFKRGLPNTIKSAGRLSVGVAGILSSSDDMMLQGAGNTIMLSQYGIKTSLVVGRTTGRVIKTSVKGGVGATKGTYNALAFIKQKGLRAAWAKARNKTATAIANAGKSVITAMVNLFKAAGQKVIVPILLIAVLVSTVMGIFAAPTVAIGGIFSGLFDTDNGDGTYTATDIREFITNPTTGIPIKRTDYINDLYTYMQGQLETNGGGYDYVRFKTNTQSNVIEPTITGISSVFYTEDDLANIIQPIFNAIILKDYELAPTDAEAKQVFSDLFNKLFRRDEAATIEWCGQSAEDGSGTPYVHDCGRIHALADCPNHDTGTHSSFTCSSCCYYYCDGHSDGDGGTDYCSGCKHACSGYDYCGGHDVLTVTLNMDGLYQLLDEYFEQPLDVLLNNQNRTPEQEKELSNLKDAYEICLEFISQISKDYGGGLTMEDLSGVAWVNGSRVGNQAMIDLALTQIGQVGGQPYWSWYGFSSRVEWCATFVSWCMNKQGHGEVRFASCNWEGVPSFKDAGRWASGGYTDVVAGDVIFFDWNGDGKAQHVGLVVGTDGEFVYTVEGNSGDTCKTKKYSLNSSVILGYGLMNY